MAPLYTASTKLAIAVMAAIFAVEVYQAAKQPISTGEAYIYDRFVRPTTRQVLAQELPNRDVLYTLLERRSVGLFHVSPFSVRLPNLLFAVLYLWSVWQLARLVLGTDRLFLVAVILAVALPLQWDCFARATGVGAALALELCAVWLTVEYLWRNHDVRTLKLKGYPLDSRNSPGSGLVEQTPWGGPSSEPRHAPVPWPEAEAGASARARVPAPPRASNCTGLGQVDSTLKLNLAGACLGLSVAARLDFALPAIMIGLAFLAALAVQRQWALWTNRLLIPGTVAALVFLVLPLSHANAAGESVPELTLNAASRLQSALEVLQASAGENHIRIGSSLSTEAIVNFYRAQHRVTTWDRADRDLASEQFDYILLSARDAEKVDQRHLIVLYQDADFLLARLSHDAM